MKIKHYLLITTLLTGTIKLVGAPTISFFFKPLFNTEKLASKLKKPGSMAKHTIRGITDHNLVSGICATYSGYITSSDNNGEIRFPRKHRESSIDIIITPELKPIPLFENTISHWEIIPENPTAMYSFKEIHNKEKNNYSWHVERKPLPANNIIPLTALVIIAKPKNITIPLTTTATNKTANLILPPVYTKKGINIVANSAYILNIRHLFQPINMEVTKGALRITTQISN